MFAALALSLLFTLTYATWAAKSERAGKLLVPILDILQSVPILGFISITVGSSCRSRQAGARRRVRRDFRDLHESGMELAFSFYNRCALCRPSSARRPSPSCSLHGCASGNWKCRSPAGPDWNTMMSMSGGWFFVVASESISVGHTSVALPGVGSYIALAIEQRNLKAIGWAIATMLIRHPAV